jgi:hypothetical protein
MIEKCKGYRTIGCREVIFVGKYVCVVADCSAKKSYKGD